MKMSINKNLVIYYEIIAAKIATNSITSKFLISPKDKVYAFVC